MRIPGRESTRAENLILAVRVSAEIIFALSSAKSNGILFKPESRSGVQYGVTTWLDELASPSSAGVGDRDDLYYLLVIIIIMIIIVTIYYRKFTNKRIRVPTGI